MIYSMTAFAKQQVQTEKAVITWELRSVNNRYLDVNFRLPDMFRDMESALRELGKKYLQRGKIDGSLRYQTGAEASDDLEVNAVLLDQLHLAMKQVKASIHDCADVDPMDVLRWPGMLKIKEENFDEIKKMILSKFEEALKDMLATRGREGEKLSAMIAERLDNMNDIVKDVQTLVPEILTAQRQRTMDRFEEMKVELDQERLEQEMVHLAQKTDVMEELDRLNAHMTEMQRVLTKGGLVGRRLDFLTQEMHREANTLGSKSIHDKTTKASVELKVLIEQIREQVQNIE